ncbi:hypothetical protein VM1G_07187 [Cytospora mali]|uniref:DNase1 protein n=1 Tax=Cytospora mali TaxID=578113 RepID=A0A194W5N0_CYTMA|nr:hypothetical protein VM1G_07187 [Valsa mali]
MQYSTLALLASAALASATNQVTFKSMDSTDRTVYFTPTAGQQDIDATNVSGGDSVTVEFPIGWIGNWYAITAGSANNPGMLGEVSFNSWGDLTYFDVSAIVNPEDTDGVYQMYPADSEDPVSGCETIEGCTNMYILSDDVQTKSTTSTHLITTLGAGNVAVSKRSVEGREAQNSPRAAVTTANWTPARFHARQFKA